MAEIILWYTHSSVLGHDRQW